MKVLIILIYLFTYTHGLSTQITKHAPKDSIKTESKLLTRSHDGEDSADDSNPENNLLTRSRGGGESEARERDGKDLKDFWCSLYTFR